MLKIIIDRERHVDLLLFLNCSLKPSIKMIGFCQHMMTLHHNTTRQNKIRCSHILIYPRLLIGNRYVTLDVYIDNEMERNALSSIDAGYAGTGNR